MGQVVSVENPGKKESVYSTLKGDPIWPYSMREIKDNESDLWGCVILSGLVGRVTMPASLPVSLRFLTFPGLNSAAVITKMYFSTYAAFDRNSSTWAWVSNKKMGPETFSALKERRNGNVERKSRRKEGRKVRHWQPMVPSPLRSRVQGTAEVADW